MCSMVGVVRPLCCNTHADKKRRYFFVRHADDRGRVFLLCKEGTEEILTKNVPWGVPHGTFLMRVLLVLFLQEKNKRSRPQSWRMASRALILTALLAGRIPDTRPTRVANASAASISHGGITDTMVEDAP